MMKKSCSRFWKTYRIITGLFLALIAVFFFFFYDYMGAYERSQPLFAAEQYLHSITDDDLYTLYLDYAKTLTTTLESPERIAEAYCSAVSQLEGDMNVLVAFSSSGESGRNFTVLKGETPIISCAVGAGTMGKYGFNEYRILSVSVVTEHLPVRSTDYCITVPKGSEVTVNGYILGAPFLSESNGIYGYSHPLEKQIHTACDTYTVTELLATPSIRCVWNEIECTGDQIDGVWQFSYPDSEKETYTIYAPGDALVTVNGITLGKEYAKEVSRPYTYSVFDSADTVLPAETVYCISGMLHEPDVKAELYGIELTGSRDNESFFYAYPDEFLYRQIFCVPQGSVVSVNGYVLGDECRTEGTPAYPELLVSANNQVQMDRYIISRLFAVSDQIRVTLAQTDLTFQITEEGREVTYRASYPDSNNGDVHALSLSFCKDYFAYTAGGYKNTDENLSRVLSYLPTNSELYRRITRSKESVGFVTPVTKQIFHALTVEAAEQLNDSTIVCSITYDIEQWTYQVKRTYSGKLWLAFEKSGDRWLITHMLTDIK